MHRQQAVFLGVSCSRLKGVNSLGFAMWLLLEMLLCLYNFHVKSPELKFADCGFPCGTMVLNVLSCTPMPHMDFKSKVRRLIEKFQDWFFYSESDDSTGRTIFFFFKVASFTLNTFFTAFYKRFKHVK